jgi:hypothetical protein
MRWLCVIVLAGCFGESEPRPDGGVHLITVDAATDSAPADACVSEPSAGCCDLMPDVDAVIACSTQGMNPGECGVAVCFAADCTRAALSFCVPD